MSGEFFQVYVKPNGSPVARLGVVVSKRVIPHAVARNYCKRLAREVFRAEQHELTGMDLVVRPRVQVLPGVAATARTEIRNLLRRARCQGLKRDAAHLRDGNPNNMA